MSTTALRKPVRWGQGLVLLTAFVPMILQAAPVTTPPVTTSSAKTPDEQRIVELRTASNAAIAAHDSVGAVKPMIADVEVIGSGGGIIKGRQIMQSAFQKVFAAPDFVTYVRNPNRVSASENVAMERGVWEGRWTDRKLVGCYMTRWEKREEEWRIIAEIYVPADPESCTASSAPLK